MKLGATAVSRIAKKFGGQSALARLLGLDRSTVCHWDRPSGLKGRDGAIPDRYHKRIIAGAKAQKIKLRPEELVNV